MSVATADELTALARELDVTPPPGAEADLLLDRAQGDVESLALRIRFTDADIEALSDEQRHALADATCLQCLWRVESEEEVLGPADVSPTPEGLTFAHDRPRLSPAVLERVALTGLIARSGTALPDPVTVPTELPWWWWV